MASPRSNGFVPIRTNGFATGLATCQAMFTMLVGSAPNEIWGPNGTTVDPLKAVLLVRTAGKAPYRRVDLTAAPAGPASKAEPPSRAPAVATPPFNTVRRERCWRNHSCCSAMVRFLAMSRVMRRGLMS